MHTSGDHSSRPREYRFGRLRELAVPGMALAAVLAGVVMLVYAGRPREFVTSDSLTLTGPGELPDSLTFVDPWGVAGVVLLVAGLLVLAFMAGYLTATAQKCRRSRKMPPV